MLRRGSAGSLVAVLFLFVRSGFAVQPFPEDVKIRGFGKVEEQQLVFVVRLPLVCIRDVQFPLRPQTEYLDLAAANSMTRGLARYWVSDRLPAYQGGVSLAKPSVVAARLAAESDQTFDSFQGALTGLQKAAIADDTNLTRNQLQLEVQLRYALRNEGGSIELEPRLADLGVHVATDLEFISAAGTIRGFSFAGDPGRFPLDASGMKAASQFFIRGMRSLAAGSDYLLFLFCLALPLRRYREITPAAVAFVAGTSLTLTASWLHLAPDGLWFRPLTGTLAGAAVLLTALANIAGKPRPRRRAFLALAAGLIFGFGLGFELASKLQFGGTHRVISAIAFNGGVVVAALILLALMVPVLAGLFRFARTERVELIVVSALAADTAWQWVSDRWAELSRYPLGLPVFDAAFFAMTLRWLAILTVFGGLVWLVNGWLAEREQRTDA